LFLIPAVGLIPLFLENDVLEAKHFWIQFSNVTVNYSHDSCYIGDVLCGADWKLIASIAGKQINLFDNTNLSSVYNNRTYPLDNKSIDIEIPENGTITLASVGIERDSESAEIPDISNITSAVKGVPYLGDAAAIANAARNVIAYAVALDKNDELGILTKDFNAINNFGVGSHYDSSCLKSDPDADCVKDYILEYSIHEFVPIPKDSLIAEVFVHENFTGPSTVVGDNIASFDDIFHDSISSIKLYTGSNYTQGDFLEICDRPYHTGECFELQPGIYDFKGFSINDMIDSIRFVRPGIS
jgi:hypothetical protein